VAQAAVRTDGVVMPPHKPGEIIGKLREVEIVLPQGGPEGAPTRRVNERPVSTLRRGAANVGFVGGNRQMNRFSRSAAHQSFRLKPNR
jgi:hypothetical protein